MCMIFLKVSKHQKWAEAMKWKKKHIKDRDYE